MPIGEYTSPDGQLKFIVVCPDGDWIMGFEGFPWHTHGSILAALSGQDDATATEHCVIDLTSNISVIAMMRTSGKLTDVWITSDPAADLSSCERYGEAGETIEFRRWDGTPVKIRPNANLDDVMDN